MNMYRGVATIEAENGQAWKDWLESNHQTAHSIWLVIYKKESNISSVYYTEAVDIALSYGWVDSKINKRDAQSFYQYFAKRNPKSNWSKVNKEKVENLLQNGQMHASGLAMIEIAKKTGTWYALDHVENLEIPNDLKLLFEKNKAAFEHWEKFPRSSKRGILEWIMNAKKPETRAKRIEETVNSAAKNIKANHPRQ